MIGTFSCEVSTGSNTVSGTFCVINGEEEPLLGKDVVTSLGVLKIGVGIGAVSADPKIPCNRSTHMFSAALES